MISLRLAVKLVLMLWAVLRAVGQSDFDRALAAQAAGRFREAATLFERVLADDGPRVGTLYNLGACRFRNGETGRAVATWLKAARAAPRDRAVGTALAIARTRTGVAPPPAWAGWLDFLRIDEWGGVALVVAWTWAGLIMLGRRGARMAVALRLPMTAAGFLAVLSLILYSAALAWRRASPDAVVVVKGAGARYGPLEESPVATSLPDGAEVRVEEELRGWVRVVDARGMGGWLPGDQLERVRN
jgi:tetratricopeptide (TPR) repeat protein